MRLDHDHVAARARRRRCTRLRRLSTTTARRTSRADDAVAMLALRIVFSRPGLERAPAPLFRVLRCGEAHLVRTWVVGIGLSGYSGLSLPASSPSLEVGKSWERRRRLLSRLCVVRGFRADENQAGTAAHWFLVVSMRACTLALAAAFHLTAAVVFVSCVKP